jgi:hypothetical protein
MIKEKVSPQPAKPRLAHRLLMAYYRIPTSEILNQSESGQDSSLADPPPVELFRISKALQGAAFTDDGRGVDYGGLQSTPAYEEYRHAASRLQRYNPAGLNDRSTQLAFWINLYNALTLDAVIQFEVQKSIQEVKGFFWRAAYNIGGWRFSAHDIEHGILRSNSPHPAVPGAHFGPGDARRRFSLADLDPRVHFALVCASKSCPPIAVYSPDAIDDQLDLATRTFINFGGVEIDRQQGTISLSKIFQWYGPDFGANTLAVGDKTALLDFAARHITSENDRDFLLNGNPRVQFQPYDWNLNRM